MVESSCLSSSVLTYIVHVRRHHDMVGICDDPATGHGSPVIQLDSFLPWNFSPLQPRSWEPDWSSLGVACPYSYKFHLWIYLNESLNLLSSPLGDIQDKILPLSGRNNLTHAYEANTCIAFCVGITSLQSFPHEFNFIFNFFPFSLKAVWFMFIVFISPEESKMAILQPLCLSYGNHYIFNLSSLQ